MNWKAVLCFVMLVLITHHLQAKTWVNDSDTNKTSFLSLETKYLTVDSLLFIKPPPSSFFLVDKKKLEKYAYHWILYYDFYTTITGYHYLNSQEKNDVNNIYFYYNLDIKNNLQFMKCKWDFYLFNDYGVKHYFDSTTNKSQDQFNLKNSIYFPLGIKKINLSISANTRTKLFPTYQYRLDVHGNPDKYLFDDFMSPGVIFYSGGITYEGPNNTLFQIGLGSSKVTKVKNQKIFQERQIDEISGVAIGQKKKSEMGLTLTSTIPMLKLGKKVYWESYGNWFTPFNPWCKPHSMMVELNNVFHAILLKYVRLSWRLKINYQYELNPKPVIQNQLSLGFYLNNHL